jgi:CHAT domain
MMSAPEAEFRFSIVAKHDQDGDQQSLVASWNVGIYLNKNLIAEQVPVRDPFNGPQNAACRWYLEQYAQKDPFSPSRAREAQSHIQGYAAELLKQLGLQELIAKRLDVEDTTQSKIQVLIDIVEAGSDAGDDSRSIHQLNWELLEDDSVWDFEEVEISVRRRIVSRLGDGLPQVPDRVNTWPQNIQYPTVNILLVVARDLTRDASTYDDVQPSTALNLLRRLNRENQRHRGHLNLHIEVVRPGTLSALDDHLRSSEAAHGRQFFHIVHFDLHGTVRKTEGIRKAFLLFNVSNQDSLQRVEAQEVARVLQKYDVPVVILNSCESARATAGTNANIAQTLEHHGVRNVLAMSFKISSDTAERYFRSFYEQLLLRRQPVSIAVHQARQALRSCLLRRGRFSREIEVLDWFVPVLYTRGQDVAFGDDQAASSENISSSQPHSNSSINPILKEIYGRDFDILRFEMLLAMKRAVYLHGRAGVGKTAFLRYASPAWIDTSFVDHIVHIDLSQLENPGQDSLQRLILTKLLMTSQTEVISDTNSILSEVTDLSSDTVVARIREFCSQSRICLVMDGLQAVYTWQPDIVVPRRISEQAAVEIDDTLRDLFFEESGALKPKIYMIMTGRLPQLSWLEPHFTFLEAFAQYELQGLKPDDAIELSEGVLRRLDHDTSTLTHADINQLGLISNLLQGLPAVFYDVFSQARTAEISIGRLYEALRRGMLATVLESKEAESHKPYQWFKEPCASEVLALFAAFNPDLVASLLRLTIFWTTGVYCSLLCFPESSRDVDPESTSVVIAAFEERGFLETDDRSMICWIHPFFTICGRFLCQRMGTFAGFRDLIDRGLLDRSELSEDANDLLDEGEDCEGSQLVLDASANLIVALGIRIPLNPRNADGAAEIVEWTLNALQKSFYFREAFMFAEGWDLRNIWPLLRGWMANVLTAIDLCTSNLDPIKVAIEKWPFQLFIRFGDFSTTGGTIAEVQLCADRYEALVNRFLALNDGLAIPPEYQAAVLHLVNWLATVHRVVISLPERRHNEFVRLGNDIIQASEAQFGEFSTSDSVYEKAFIMRQEAFSFLEAGRVKECVQKLRDFLQLDTREFELYQKEVKIEEESGNFWGHSGFSEELGEELAQRLAADGQDPDAVLARLKNARPRSKEAFHHRRQPMLEAAITILENCDNDDPTSVELLEEALGGVQFNLNMLRSSEAASGITGFEDDPLSMPGDGNILKWYRNHDARGNELLRLEHHLGSGNSDGAIRSLETLRMKAFADLDYEQGLLQVDELIKICEKEPMLASRLPKLRQDQELFKLVKTYAETMESLCNQDVETATQAAEQNTQQMMRLLSIQPGEHREYQLKALELSQDFWKNGVRGRAMKQYLSSNAKTYKDEARKLMNLIMKLARTPERLQELKDFHVKIMELAAEVSKCEAENRLENALAGAVELEKLAKTDFGPYFLDAERLTRDREGLEWKIKFVATTDAWGEQLERGDYEAARARIDECWAMKQMAIAKENHLDDTSYLTNMYETTEDCCWDADFVKLGGMVENEENEEAIARCDNLLKLHESGFFSHLDKEKMDDQIGMVKQIRAIADWNREWAWANEPMLDKPAKHAETVCRLDKLITECENGRFSDSQSDATGDEPPVQRARDARLRVLLLDAMRESRWQDSMTLCTQYCTANREIIARNPRKYDWVNVWHEDTEIFYHYNEALRADDALDFISALGHLDKIAELIQKRQRIPEIDRSGTMVKFGPELIGEMREKALKRIRVMDTLGPTLGRLTILAGRRQAGYSAHLGQASHH